MQRYAVRLAQGGLERLPGRVLTRRLGGKGKGRPNLLKGGGLERCCLGKVDRGRLVRGCQPAFDMGARLLRERLGVLTRTTREGRSREEGEKQKTSGGLKPHRSIRRARSGHCRGRNG